MLKEKLTVALVQTQLAWEDPEQNRNVLEKKIRSAAAADIIVLPEMFTSGFTMNPERVAETMDGITINWLKQLAEELGVAITGSLVIEAFAKYNNRLVFVHPNGEVDTYDKKHLFTLAGEDKVYQAGRQKLIVEYLGWKICPMICYDLRFPVWARNSESYDILLYVANWPAPRITAWDALLKARAIENMSYVVGVNRVGLDANDYRYVGSSAVYDVLGHQIVNSEEEEVLICELHKDHIDHYRQKLRFLDDKDNFNLV